MKNGPEDRFFTIPAGAVMKEGGSLNLVRGQIGLFNINDVDVDGLQAVSSLDGLPKREKVLELRAGGPKSSGSRMASDKSFSSMPFSVFDVVDVYAKAPQITKPLVDCLILGYNGIDPETAFKMEKGIRIPVKLSMTGRQLGRFGFPSSYVTVEDVILPEECTNDPLSCDAPCDPCGAVDTLTPVLNFIDRLNEQPVYGNVKVKDLVNISIIKKCDNMSTPTTEDVNFFELHVCDAGASYSLGLVQAQYPGMKIKRAGRNGAISIYKVMTKEDSLPDYNKKLSAILPDCGTCTVGDKVGENGYLYSVILEDDGADMSSTVEGLTNAVAGTAKKENGQVNGIGMYSVVLTKKLTKANLKTFMTANPTATVQYACTVRSMCQDPAIESIAWTKVGTCKISTAKYQITFPDDECGNSGLAELQAAYPELTISQVGDGSGCQHRFETTVYTKNMVCPECDPIFEDLFQVEAPEPYLNRQWQLVEHPNQWSGNCLVGVKFESKLFKIDPSICLAEGISYAEDSLELQVTAGYPEELVQNSKINPFGLVHVEYLSHAVPRMMLGADMRELESESYGYFKGREQLRGNVAQALNDEVTLIPENSDQYVDFVVCVSTSEYAQGGVFDRHENYHILCKYGDHYDVQELVNMIAAAANLPAAKV